MGRGAKPEYSLWDGDHLLYIEARLRIYAPLYAQAVEQTQAWVQLQRAYQKAQKRKVPLGPPRGFLSVCLVITVCLTA